MYRYVIIFLGLNIITRVYSETEYDVDPWIGADDSSLNQRDDSVSLSSGGSDHQFKDQEEKYTLKQKNMSEVGESKLDAILHKKSKETRSKGQQRKSVGHNRFVNGKTMRYMIHENPKLNRLNKNKVKSHKTIVESVSNEINKGEVESVQGKNPEPVTEINIANGMNNSEKVDDNIELNHFDNYLDANDSNDFEDQNEESEEIDDETDNVSDNGNTLEENKLNDSKESTKSESTMNEKSSNRTDGTETKTNTHKSKSYKSSATINYTKNKDTKGIDTGFIDNLRKDHLNRLIERKLKAQLKHKVDSQNKPLHNIKFTNLSFIDDFQKKLQIIKDRPLFNSKFIVSDKKLTNNNENSDWIFDQGDIHNSLKDKTVEKQFNEKFGHVHENQNIERLTNNKNIREHEIKEKNNKGHIKAFSNNNSQSVFGISHPKLENGYKTNFKCKQMEEENIVLVEDPLEPNIKINKVEKHHNHNKRTKTKNNKISPNENSITDYENSKDRKRNQRDIKGTHSKVKHHKGAYEQTVEDENELDDENKENDAESPESVEDGDLEPRYHRRVQTNDDDDYSYKSRNQDSGENELSGGDDADKSDESKGMFARRAQESKYNNEISATETCVGYRAGGMATTCGGKSTIITHTTLKPMLSTQRRGNINIKTKNTTSRTTNSTKKVHDSPKSKDFRNNGVPIEVLDMYDKFLCGQLIDDFIEAVLVKVRRSPKIQKELGFQNDTEETCDRCIETKLLNIPDLDTMKTSLGKCTKSSTKSNCFKCYNVPKPMDKFLSMLVSYGKEHETSVYNKIKDESSFIFNGDYSDQPAGSGEGNNNNKYNQDNTEKDNTDRERLKEDSNEEKSDEQVSSHHLNEKSNNEQSEYSKDTEEDNEAEKPGSKSNFILSDVNKETDDKSGPHEKPQIRTVTSLKDIDLEDEFDPPVPVRNKFISYKDPELGVSDGSSDSYLTKDMRKPYNQDKQQHKSFYSSDKLKYDMNGKIRPYDEVVGSGIFDSVPSKNMHSNQNMFSSGFQDSYGNSKLFGGNVNSNHFSYKENPSYKNEFTSDHDSRIKHTNQYYSYPSENDHRFRMYPEMNKQMGRATYNSDLGVMGSSYDEYPLVPNQNRHSNKNVGGIRAKDQQYDTYQEDGLKMVKRDIEPTDEEETVVFEIPDVEYDLY